MGELVKATFTQLKQVGTEENKKWQIDGEAIKVQLNPTSLRLNRSNCTDAKTDKPPKAGRQASQHPDVDHATLTFDLEFDTADEGTTDAPVDVLKRTDDFRKFVVPPKGATTQAPPAAMFQWGPFTFPGVVTQFNEEIDYFASDGTPLHLKVSISMNEINFQFQTNASPRQAKDDDSFAAKLEAARKVARTGLQIGNAVVGTVQSSPLIRSMGLGS